MNECAYWDGNDCSALKENEDLIMSLVEALNACEENLRLIHEALGPVPKDAPMPKYCTFEAWKMAKDAIKKYEETIR